MNCNGRASTPSTPSVRFEDFDGQLARPLSHAIWACHVTGAILRDSVSASLEVTIQTEITPKPNLVALNHAYGIDERIEVERKFVLSMVWFRSGKDKERAKPTCSYANTFVCVTLPFAVFLKISQLTPSCWQSHSAARVHVLCVQ